MPEKMKNPTLIIMFARPNGTLIARSRPKTTSKSIDMAIPAIVSAFGMGLFRLDFRGDGKGDKNAQFGQMDDNTASIAQSRGICHGV